MKFYNCKGNRNYLDKIEKYELTAIFYKTNKNFYIQFFKNGQYHNSKNADYIDSKGNRFFSLNYKFYGDEKTFTKHSWRKFVKLKAFL